jgi:surfeit locus 1 family protein
MGRLIFLLVIGLAGLGVLISLGIWQVQRLAWKQAILTTIEDRIAADPVELPQQFDPVTDKYLPVELSGTIGQGELHVLTSIRDIGPGYRIIAAFTANDGRRILLDRGFVPADRKNADRPTGQAGIIGNLHWPNETDSYTPAPDLNGNIWFARDAETMARALGTLPVFVITRKSSDPNTGVTPLPVDTASIPNNHLQYAITWFSLAAIWAAMTSYFLWRTRAKSEG